MLTEPFVIYKTSAGLELTMSLTSRLMMDRIIFCHGEITDELATSICMQLRHLDAEDSKKPIHMMISSPGGSVSAGFEIINTMNDVNAPVSTTINGIAASMGAVIAASGTKGHRQVYPNSRIMIHQTSGGARGKFTDVKINYTEHEKINENVIRHLAKVTKTKYEKLLKDCESDNWMSDAEWLKYGGCDKVKQLGKTKPKS